MYLYQLTIKQERMNIFQITNNVVTFSPQALVLEPFREIWDSDISKDKVMAVKELSYVYYMADDRSDYQYILDEDERSKEISHMLGLGDNWIVPTYIPIAIEFYKETSKTTSTMLLRSTRGVIQKISHLFDTVDLGERDKMNKPVFDLNKITGAVEKVPKLIKALAEVEKEIIKELAMKAQSGNKEMGLFEDGQL